MEIVNRVSRMAAITAKTLVTDVKVGLVPTAGAIGSGQLNLIQSARKMADLAVVSIFVNRLEFSSEEEYLRYPRDITADIDLLRQENIDYVFIPPEEELYPPDFTGSVDARIPGSELPQFLTSGMTTGALKIMHLVKPAYTFYGEQDAVQAALLRKMVRDFNISTEVVTVPIAREASGLAYSGRNRLLTESQLDQALMFFRCLTVASDAIASRETNSKKILSEMAKVAGSDAAAKLVYAVTIDPERLESVSRIEAPAVIGVGGKIGNVFLSDAILVGKTTGNRQ
jgi:pantoate--beta-alanine ligase